MTAIACHVLSAYKFVCDDVKELPAELILVVLLVIVRSSRSSHRRRRIVIIAI